MKKTLLLFSALSFLSACGNNDSARQAAVPPVQKDSIAIAVPDGTTVEADTGSGAANVAPVAVPPEGLALKLNLQPGKTYSQTMDIQATQGGGKMTTGINWTYDMKVLEAKKGVTTLGVTYRRIGMSMGMNGQKMELSSESQSEASPTNPLGMMTALFKAMRGKSFRLQVADNGAVVAVEGFEDMAKSVVAEMGVSEEMKGKVQQAFESQFNEGMVKDMFGQSFNIYPNKKIKVGDSWEKKGTSRMGRNALATNTRYTVQSIRGNKVHLAADATLNMEGEEAKSKGSYVVDARTGFVLSGDFRQTFAGGKGESLVKIQGREQ